MFNSTMDNGDTFPLSYEEDHIDSSSIILNHSYYDDFLSFDLNKTTASSKLFFSSPFIYIVFIVVFYFILTLILLIFSLYKQRQTELENFYFGDTEEEIEQSKRSLLWKQLLIGRIKKGDMQPLLTDSNNEERTVGTFPLYVV